ncbi:hypothetical protein ACNPQM_43550 [Streptomyces sp. NPDC056231]|jgi:hypothetical protein
MDAVARALQLDETEREYFLRLTRLGMRLGQPLCSRHDDRV